MVQHRLSECRIVCEKMLTPYDWQEAIGHRISYVQSRLAGGAPVLAVSLEEGVLALTVRRQARKIYEVYDRLLFAGLGQQSDIESLRVAAIDFAHQEGYQRSEPDVTIQRVISALSTPMKRSFGDFNSSPFVVRSLFAEVGAERSEDKFYLLDFDGDYSIRQGYAVLAGGQEVSGPDRERLQALSSGKAKINEAQKELESIWANAMDTENGKSYAELTKDLTPEVALLSRDPQAQSRFRLLSS